jgi:diadenosine tetraphosphate (Ap4A) HIT family hydrolase
MTQLNFSNEFRKKFQLDKLTILQNEHWILSVRPEQLTLGSMVLSSAKGKVELSQLSAEEGAEMVRLLGIAERLAKEKFGAVRINVLCLMMQDPLVHFHILPRYKKNVVFNDDVWIDKDYPKPPAIKPIITDDKVLSEVSKLLRD